MAKATSVKSSSDRKEAHLDTLHDDLPVLQFISHFECMNAICVLHFQQNKLFVHSARSGDSIARFKDRIETVYLDRCG